MNSPRTRRYPTVGKKSLRSTLITTSAPTWGVALETMERPTRKPWAASWAITGVRRVSSTHRWACLSRGIGALIDRTPPVFFGTVNCT